jgi:phosphoribosyl 1,2-cyclic phosphodiesterase
MIDCGADWLGRLCAVAPTAIILTHAHPDHVAGLADGAPCPVYATKDSLELLRRFPITDRRRLAVGKPVIFGSLNCKAHAVQHSIRAPAVGYRVWTEAGAFFYLPDVAGFPGAATALRGIDVYIGDGATIRRSMVRRRSGTLIGHAPIAAQLGWCAEAGVRRAVFTHCGSPIVNGDARVVNAVVRRLGDEHGVDASVACDGDRLSFPVDGQHGRLRKMLRRV